MLLGVISFFLLLVSHALFLIYDENYRKKTTRDKINICSSHVRQLAFIFIFFSSTHYVLKNVSLLFFPRVYLLLWLVNESLSFNIILFTHVFIHKGLALLLAITTPLNHAQACFIVFVSLSKIT